MKKTRPPVSEPKEKRTSSERQISDVRPMLRTERPPYLSADFEQDPIYEK
ncbi:MAG: hypothetical protein ABR981_01010 [Candidatus Micrarchaeaceae archaeon]|jgi:hypothetical protein